MSFALVSIALQPFSGFPILFLGSVICGITSGVLGIISFKRGEVKWVALTALILGLMVALTSLGALGLIYLFVFA